MRSLFSVVASLFAVVSVANGEAVVSLTDATFDAHVKQYKYVLAEFFAPWCGHCKSLAPEYEKAAQHFAGQTIEGGLSIVAVDATESKELASRFGVQGFPTLKWIVNEQPSEYSGGRVKDEIVAWINKKTGPATTPIADEAALTAFKESADVTVFGYFANAEAAKQYVAVAEQTDDVVFALSHTFSAGLEANTVVVYRKFEGEEPTVKCENSGDKEAIAKCVSGNSLPLLIPFSNTNAPKIFGGSIKQHVLVFLDNSADGASDVLAAARPVAVEQKGEYLFVTVDKSDDRILDFFGITAADLPTVRIVEMNDSGMKKFALEGAYSEDAVRAFVKGHIEGTVSQSLKSQDDIADDAQDQPTWTLVGKNHDRVVFGGKNVLVKYYAPWCGHCKKLVPDYEKLAEHYKGDDKVIVAKMDSTENEVSTVSVQGFPTLKFYPAGCTDADCIVEFDGERNFEGMKAFIEKERK